MLQKIKNNFNPLMFLAPLGAGGIAVSAFIIIQYGIFSGKGLATFSQITQTPLSISMEVIMIIFSIIHIALSILFFSGFFHWKKNNEYTKFKNNPLVNSGLMAPLVSLAMSMNIAIAVFRYFSDWMSENFQSIMAPAFGLYIILWLAIVFTAISLLKIAFVKTFDVDKIHFGWLLQPFALGMITVTGTGFAALAKNTESISYNSDLAGVAAFLSVISGTMAVFLLSVKVFSIFKKHLSREGTLDNHFVPTYLIVLPIITVIGISIFRLGHYMEKIYHEEVFFILAKIAVFTLFAFEVWYLAFGLAMVKDYWKGYLSKKYHVSQWGMICPFVAFVALGMFFSKIFFTNIFSLYFFSALLVATSGLYLYLFKRQFKCINNNNNAICDK